MSSHGVSCLQFRALLLCAACCLCMATGAAVALHRQQQTVLAAAGRPPSTGGGSGGGGSAGPPLSRFSLLSCFRELPSVNTAPPPTDISIVQQQQQQQQGLQLAAHQMPPRPTAHAAGFGATASSGARPGSSLADVPAVVMSVILRQLHAADLARLSCVCRGLRAASWEAVPGLRLTLYPHQV
jgi:hypothetical protein